MPYSFPTVFEDSGSLVKDGESSVQLSYIVPFADIPTIATAVLSNVVVHYMFPAFICKSVAYEPFSKRSDAGQFELAKVVLTFGPVKNDEDDPDSEEDPPIYEVSLDISGESVTLPRSAYKLDSGSGDPLNDKFPAPSKIVPQSDIKLTLKNQTSIDVDKVESFIGKVNSGTFNLENKAYAAGKVIFLGISTSHERDSEGVKKFDVTYNFQTHKESWQKIWDAEAGNWRTINPNLYETGDLDDLLGI